MSRIFYTSDLHFQHKFVAGLRGFDTPEEHDAIILENWNKNVRKDDVAFILGDFAMNWKNIEDKIKAMNGRKVLIAGNHDVMFPGFRDAWKHQRRYIREDLFEAIELTQRRKVGKHEFLMSHFPYTGDHVSRDRPEGDDRYEEYRLRDTGMWLVHGHTHSEDKLMVPAGRIWWTKNGPKYRDLQLHVGVDAWNLNPVTEDEVLHMMAEVNAKLILDAA